MEHGGGRPGMQIGSDKLVVPSHIWEEFLKKNLGFEIYILTCCSDVMVKFHLKALSYLFISMRNCSVELGGIRLAILNGKSRSIYAL